MECGQPLEGGSSKERDACLEPPDGNTRDLPFCLAQVQPLHRPLSQRPQGWVGCGSSALEGRRNKLSSRMAQLLTSWGLGHPVVRTPPFQCPSTGSALGRELQSRLPCGMAKSKEKQLLNLVLSLSGRCHTCQHHPQTQTGWGRLGSAG